jgi:hypothetical protein
MRLWVPPKPKRKSVLPRTKEHPKTPEAIKDLIVKRNLSLSVRLHYIELLAAASITGNPRAKHALIQAYETLKHAHTERMSERQLAEHRKVLAKLEQLEVVKEYLTNQGY